MAESSKRLELLVDVQSKQAETNLLNFTNTFNQLNIAIQKVSVDMRQFVQINQTVNTTFNATNIEAKKLDTSLRKTLRIGLTVILIRRAVRAISSLIKSSSEWTENLNLFVASFGDNYKQTLDWTLELSKRLGLSNNELVRSVGLFKQLGSALGIADTTSTRLAKTLSSQALDLSSLFNIDIQTSIEKINAIVFGGQAKPGRAIGIDATAQTLDNLLKTNEALAKFGVSSRMLTQENKVLLRALVLLQQSSNAWGDMYQTIENTQGQIKILYGAFDNLKVAIGDSVGFLAQGLKYISGFMIGMTSIIRAFTALKTTAKRTNVTDNNILKDFADDADNLEQSLGLLSFDNFESLVKNDSKFANDLSITEAITAELAKWQDKYEATLKSLGEIETEAVKIGEAIKNWFIVTDDLGKFVEWTNSAKVLLVSLTAIGAVLAGLKISSIFAGIVGSFGAIQSTLVAIAGTLSISVGWLIAIIASIGVIIASITYLYNTNEKFKDSVQRLFDIFKNLANVFLTLVVDVFKKLEPVITTIGDALAIFLNSIADIMIILSPVIEKLLPIFLAISYPLITLIVLADKLGILNPLLKIFLSVFMKILFPFTVIIPLANATAKAIIKVTEAVIKFKNFVFGIGDGIKNLFFGLMNGIIEANRIITSILNFIKIDGVGIGDIFAKSFSLVLSSIRLSFLNVVEFIKSSFSNLINVFSLIAKDILTIFINVINLSKNMFIDIWSSINEPFIQIFTAIGNTLKVTFKGIINFIIDGVNVIINSLNKLNLSKIGINLGFDIPPIPAFASGGFVEDGLFQANKGELIGKFSDGSTVVANNNQIIEGIKKGVQEAMAPFFNNSLNEQKVTIVIDGANLQDSTIGRFMLEAIKPAMYSQGLKFLK